MKTPFINSVIALCLVFVASAAQAEITWNNFSLSYLGANNYLDPFSGEKDKGGRLLTFEAATAFSWGKSFVFIDRLSSDDGIGETYSEVGFDYSIGRHFQNGLDRGLLKDVFIALQWERPNCFGPCDDERRENYLAGLGASWTVPGFSYLNSNVYHRSNTLKNDNYQLTVVWSVPITVGSSKLYFDGFIDLETASESKFGGPEVASIVKFQPQLKFDVGNTYGKPGKLFVGVEFDIWRNKFGQKNQNQFTPQLMVHMNL